jgi:hypothetical protein
VVGKIAALGGCESSKIEHTGAVVGEVAALGGCESSKNEHARGEVGAYDQKMNMRVVKSVRMIRK